MLLFRLCLRDSIAHYTLLRKGALSEGKDLRLTTGDASHHKGKATRFSLTIYSAERLTWSLCPPEPPKPLSPSCFAPLGATG